MNTTRRWAALGALALAVLVIGLDLTVLNVALPTLAGQLPADTKQLQWIVDAYVLAFAGAMLPAGWLGDRFGRALVLRCGLAGFGAASMAAAYAASASSLVLARIAMGLAAAVVMPLAMALVPALFQESERQRAVTVMVAAVGLGLPLGPVVGGALLSRYWWGSVFLVTVPVVVASLLACAVLLPRTPPEVSARPDLAGGAAAVLGIVAVTSGLIEAPGWGWASPRTVGCLAGAVAAFTVAARRQRVAVTPVIPSALLRNRVFVRGTAVTALVTFVLTGVLFLLPLYLQLVAGNSAMGTGLRLAPFMLALVFGGALAERTAHRTPLTVPVTAGLASVAAGTLLLARLHEGTPYPGLALGLTVAGFGVGLTMAPVMDRVLGALPQSAEGIGSAANNAARQVAGALGVALLGSLTATLYRSGVDTAAGELPAPVRDAVRESLTGAHDAAATLPPAAAEHLISAADAAFTHGLNAAMLICAAICAVAALLTPRLLAAHALTGAGRDPERPGSPAVSSDLEVPHALTPVEHDRPAISAGPAYEGRYARRTRSFPGLVE